MSLRDLSAILPPASLQNLLQGGPDPIEYQTRIDLDLYDSPKCDRLATQVATGRHLRLVALPLDSAGQLNAKAVQVRLCEDNYPGWLAIADLATLEPAETAYSAIALTEAEIQALLPAVIGFTHAAMEQPNHYLWGGTVGPHYDCSGLIQAAFSSVGIWLPRDAYQQEAFTQSVTLSDLQPGDLIFFGPPEKATHVGLYLGEGLYIHSSGKDQGRDGIGVDRLSEQGDTVSQTYYRQLRGAGRVVSSYQPQEQEP